MLVRDGGSFSSAIRLLYKFVAKIRRRAQRPTSAPEERSNLLSPPPQFFGDVNSGPSPASASGLPM